MESVHLLDWSGGSQILQKGRMLKVIPCSGWGVFSLIRDTTWDSLWATRWFRQSKNGDPHPASYNFPLLSERLYVNVGHQERGWGETGLLS